MTAPTLTAQEVFDIAVGGVLRQGQTCVERMSSGYTHCVYRGPNGMKCAAGFVFTDDEVYGMNDGYSAAEIVEARAHRLDDHAILLNQLQSIHDDAPVDSWPANYRDLADRFELSTAVIDQWEAEQKRGDA